MDFVPTQRISCGFLVADLLPDLRYTPSVICPLTTLSCNERSAVTQTGFKYQILCLPLDRDSRPIAEKPCRWTLTTWGQFRGSLHRKYPKDPEQREGGLVCPFPEEGG